MHHAAMMSTPAPGYPAMEWIVAPSAEERARGQLLPQTLAAAHAAFRSHGCLLLPGALPPALIDAMHRDYEARYGALDAHAMQEQSQRPFPNPVGPRGKARYEITLRMNGAFGAPGVFANPLLYSVLAPLLGGDMQLNSFTIVTSYPGAPMQEIHRDHGHLFTATDPDVGPSLPVYAVNVVVPLIDVDLETGPTGVWPGSHRWRSEVEAPPDAITACPIRRGDCMLLDYRTLHTGLPNQSARVRPVLYMVYARGWFFDDMNHFGVNTPDMSLEDYRSIPEQARMPLERALSQAMRNQARELERDARPLAPARAASGPSSWGKVGRNDPCPCGSGRKYKQCHGRVAA
jgi:hypothetical protein